MTVSALCLFAALSSGAPVASHTPRIAVLDIQAQGAMPAGLVQGVTSVVVHDVRKLAVGATVVGADEIRAMMGLEHEKQLLGCAEVSCLAEVGGALGAERLVLGSLSRFGDTYVLDVKLVESRTAKVLAEGSTRVKREGDLPEAVERTVRSLFPQGALVSVDGSARLEISQPGPAPAAEPAKAGPTDRIYCAWLDPATAEAQATLTSLGYDATMTEDYSRVLVTKPKDGVSLRIELINLVGKTRVKVMAIPPSKGQPAIEDFFASYEAVLHLDKCRPDQPK